MHETEVLFPPHDDRAGAVDAVVEML